MSLRVLVISHPAVVPAYRRKFDLIAESNEIELRLIVPEGWREESRDARFDRDNAPVWATALPVAFQDYYARYFFTRGIAEPFAAFKPDIVHLEEEPYSLCAAQTLWMLRRFAPNARLIFRTSVGARIRLKRLAEPLLRAIERRVYRRADAAFAVSRRAAQFVRDNGYSGEVRVFPNGLDTRIFKPLDAETRRRVRASLNIAEHAFVAGYVGKLVPDKGVDLLLDALAETSDTYGMIVGAGDHQTALEAYAARLGLSERVRFTGALPPERVAAHMNAMDALALPSRTTPQWIEFFGRVIPEAMACGVPVIGSSSGEIPSTVGDAGFIFPEGNVRALAESLKKVRADASVAAEMRSRGLIRVRNEYSWEAVAANTVEAYGTLSRR